MTKRYVNIICLALLIISYGCSTTNNKDYNLITNYVKKNFNGYNTKKQSCILLLTENGCIPCNRMYAKFIQDRFINKDNAYIVLCASGSIVDIKPFIFNDSIKNVCEDEKEIFTKEIYPYSAAILIKENKVDTIIQITSTNIEKTFDYIFGEYNNQ